MKNRVFIELHSGEREKCNFGEKKTIMQTSSNISLKK
jgi:hypothetical protein